MNLKIYIEFLLTWREELFDRSRIPYCIELFKVEPVRVFRRRELTCRVGHLNFFLPVRSVQNTVSNVCSWCESVRVFRRRKLTCRRLFKQIFDSHGSDISPKRLIYPCQRCSSDSNNNKREQSMVTCKVRTLTSQAGNIIDHANRIICISLKGKTANLLPLFRIFCQSGHHKTTTIFSVDILKKH